MPTTPGQEATDVVASATAGDARITTLEISNFRGLTDVRLEGLGLVNLVVGRNNTGKTSLLEAVAIACENRELRECGSWLRQPGTDLPQSGDRQVLSIDAKDGLISAKGSGNTYTVTFWDYRSPAPSGVSQSAVNGSRSDSHYRWIREASGEFILPTAVVAPTQNPKSVTSEYSKVVEIGRYEQLIESILAKVDPRIRSIRLTLDGKSPSLVLDVGLARRVPITHVGQGIARIIAIISRIVASEARICLIDEIENGIHYTALPELWRGIRQVASELGVQIFATTHSKECLEAATRVFVEEDPERKHDFSVIQLFRIRDGIAGRVLTEERVAEALDSDIELR